MYKEFYGLRELPFALTPDPRFVYFTPSHTEAMANLHYGVESGKGLIVVTGEVGTGKTTILRWMMQRLDRNVLVGYIFNPRLSVPEFYQHVTRVLGVDEWENKSDLLFKLGKVLESRHERGLRTVLIVDEAHGLSTSVLEEIRLMSNYESDSAKLLQVILTGQPELRDVLNDPALRQLKQRVALRCEIRPLPNIEETEKYIKSRLETAGAQRTDIFTQSAIDYIYRCSEGIPRQINNLCDNALLAGYSAGEPTVTRAVIEEVAETFDMLPRPAAGRPGAEEREAPARIFDAKGREELWSAGSGDAHDGANGSNANGNGSNGATSRAQRGVNGGAGDDETEASRAVDVSDIGAAFRRWDAMGER
ncbi:MAG: AAA family ATPase [Acidobacteriota bacterium]|nr:AAA family ATPase [Acidobacteriota bacterium]